MCDNGEAATPSASISRPFDPAYYTWSLLFRAILGRASDADIRKYVHNKSLVHEAADCARCERQRDWLLEFSPPVSFLRQQIQKLGGELNAENIECRRCDTLGARGPIRGAFNGGRGILLCANHIKGRKNLEDVLTHEMVHAYDTMRFQMDRANLKHVACTEIRAALLSGECRWAREFFTHKQFKFTMHFQDCVRRRATLAVKIHPQCKDDLHAVRTVNEVWEPCFADTRPFDEIYR